MRFASTTGGRPTQAVILSGGRGTRLRPLTDHRPKAMVEIHGKPFLEYLVELLRAQGFTRVLLLLGYLPETIQDYFGDGRRWGVDISYSVTPPEDETSRRVKQAESYVDPCFLLMYCDNYWPMQFGKMWRRFEHAGFPAMITVYSNKDGYTRNSVRVEPDGLVSVYDKSCAQPGLNGVEISYALIKKETLGLLSGENVPFEVALYPRLCAESKLMAFVSGHRYYSVGSHRRLPVTEKFFRRLPAVILDRDGVLNKRPARAHYVRSWAEFEWLPGALEALRLFAEHGYQVVVVSNQAGIARGATSRSAVEEIHRRMRRDAEKAGGAIAAIYYCPHDWEEGCDCRKPKAGMLFQAQRDLDLDLSRVVFIGDDERDGAAAEQAGCPFIQVTSQTSILQAARKLLVKNPEFGERDSELGSPLS